MKTIEDKNDICSWNIPAWNELDIILANKGWDAAKAHIANRILLDALWLSYQEREESQALLHTAQHLINEVSHIGHPAGSKGAEPTSNNAQNPSTLLLNGSAGRP